MLFSIAFLYGLKTITHKPNVELMLPGWKLRKNLKKRILRKTYVFTLFTYFHKFTKRSQARLLLFRQDNVCGSAMFVYDNVPQLKMTQPIAVIRNQLYISKYVV